MNTEANVAGAWVGRVVVMAALCGTVVGCSTNDKPEANAVEASAGLEAVPVKIDHLKRGDIRSSALSTTNLSAKREQHLRAEVGGVVRQLEVEEGDLVKEGDLLMRLSRSELNIAVASARGNVARFKREITTTKPLVAKGFVARQSLTDLDFQLTQAKDQLARANTDLARLTIKAPLNGVVAKRLVSVGDLVSPGAEVLYVVDPKDLDAVIHVPERSLSSISVGTPAIIIAEALGGASFDGKVRLISPIVNAQTGTIKVTVGVTQPAEGPRLRAGMFVQARLVTAQHQDALLVPRRALVYTDNRAFVFVVQDIEGKTVAHKQEIALGFEENGHSEVLKGLDRASRVIVIGQSGLKEGAVVEIVGH